MYRTPFFPRAACFSHYLINPPVPGRQGGPGGVTRNPTEGAQKGREGSREGNVLAAGHGLHPTREYCLFLAPRPEVRKIMRMVALHQGFGGTTRGSHRLVSLSPGNGLEAGLMVPILQMKRLSSERRSSLPVLSEGVALHTFLSPSNRHLPARSKSRAIIDKQRQSNGKRGGGEAHPWPPGGQSCNRGRQEAAKAAHSVALRNQ